MRRVLAFSALAAALAFGQEFKLGSKVTDFNVQDLNGGSTSFSALRGPITVVTFVSVRCPVSNAYNDRMNSVYRDYSAKGVKFIFVNANSNESPSDVREHAKSVGFAFPVYKDQNNQLADRFNAQVTPESYVIDESGTIRYHGQIDDSQSESRVSARRLRAALDALLSGSPISAQETKAFGCSIKRARRSS